MALDNAKVGLWENLTITSKMSEVVQALVNATDSVIELRQDDCVGRMYNPDFYEVEISELNDEKINTIFGTIRVEPAVPKKGRTKPISKSAKTELLKNRVIDCPKQWRQEYEKLIVDYHDVISKDPFDLGWTDVISHKIHMRYQVPSHSRQFRVPFEHERTLHKYIDKLLKKGTIEVSRSPYNSAIFCVEKKALPGADPKAPRPLRCVLDYRQINEKSMPDEYCTREVRECIDEVGKSKSKVFLTIDLTSGFWQMEMTTDSREYTAFTVPGKGTHYQWKVAPMGLQSSPASFTRLMDFMMRGLTGVLTYIYDVLVHTGCHKEILKQLEGTLLRLRRFGLKMNAAKSILRTSEVQYLGYTLRPGGVSLSKDKLGALRAFPPPTTPKQIREFVGICNYFRFLVPSFSRQAAPLLKLTRATSEWKEGPLPPEALTAFQDLKKALISEPILGHPARDKMFILHTIGALGDATNAGGLGAVLMQQGDDGNNRVIAYASRQLKGYEKNYSAYDRSAAE
jgi:hypothetical protein